MRISRAIAVLLALTLGLGIMAGCKGKKPKTQSEFMASNGRPTTEDIYAVPGVDSSSGLTGSTLNTPGGMMPDGVAESRLPEDLGQGYFEEALPVIYFAFDSFDLAASEMDKLDRLVAPYILANAAAHIQIEGHCDSRGTEDYNMSLGQKRASIVRDHLIAKGCNEANLHTISYGEERPVDPGENETAYTQNRRVQFLVYFTE